ncbi:MAG: YbhN family protein [Halobacteria archaeon]
MFSEQDLDDMKRLVTGFIAALLILAFFLWAVGIHKIISLYAQMHTGIFLLGILSTFIGMVAWSSVWHRVIAVVEHRISRVKVFLIFLSAQFANHITPFGQVGGEPFIALVLTKYTDISYEKSLAGVISSDLINFFPFFTYGSIGFLYFLIVHDISGTIKTYAIGFAVVLGATITAAVLIWRKRGDVKTGVLSLTNFIRDKLGRYSDKLYYGLEPELVKERLDDFFGTLSFIGENKDRLVLPIILAHIGWFFVILPLYMSSMAINHTINFPLIFLIIPVASLAGYLPSPGGLGGVEVFGAVVITVVTSINITTATAIFLLYRISVFWFTILIGGISLGHLSVGMKEITEGGG